MNECILNFSFGSTLIDNDGILVDVDVFGVLIVCLLLTFALELLFAECFVLFGEFSAFFKFWLLNLVSSVMYSFGFITLFRTTEDVDEDLDELLDDDILNYCNWN